MNMKKSNVVTISLFLIFSFHLSFLFAQHPMQKHGRLRVSDNKHFLQYSDGTPFFWLGDTAWELFHRLDREEATKYLKDRQKKGFTVIQAVVLAELDGLRDPNPYGQLPLVGEDPTKPNEAYFQHVDFIVNKAQELGIFIGMLPTWGDKVFKDNWGKGPEIFNPTNAKIYGEFIGKRYRDKPVIWIIGGDRHAKPDHLPIWRALAEGITEGAGGSENALMTFHPQPNGNSSSSQFFHNDTWLDFNMFQNGHCRDVPVYERITGDYNLIPTKPTIDGEPLYEDHPVCFNANEFGYSVAADLRKFAYWSLFAGAFGHTYGCHNVWQMYDPKRIPINSPKRPWYESLNLDGAVQMSYVKKLMTSRPILSRIPDQNLISSTQEKNPDYAVGTRSQNGDYAFIYIPTGKNIEINLDILSGKRLKATWYNPRNGKNEKTWQLTSKGKQTFSPPSSGKGNDWVLVLDNEDKNFKKL